MFGNDPRLLAAVYEALRKALLLSPEEGAGRIFRAYADPPPPQVNRDMDLCFYHLTPDAAAPMLREQMLRNGRWAVFRFIPCRLFLVFYGNAAETWALRARENLFTDGADAPRGLLRKAGLYLLPPVSPPAVLREEEGSLYRRRADLTLDARLADNSDAPGSASGEMEAPTVEIIPEISLQTLDQR